MSTKIIIGSSSDETRMGLVEDGVLKEYLVERNIETHLVGSIFLGKVSNVVAGIQAAFIDIGLEKNAFLYLGEENNITEGASVLVQIVKDARGTKGPTAVREITLPGRYVVLFPKADYIGISRKIGSQDERDRLKEIVSSYKPENMGVVIRTVAEGVEEAALREDIKRLVDSWKVIEARQKVSKAPAFLYRELDLSVRIVRDYLNDDVKEIILDNKNVYMRIESLLEGFGDINVEKISLYEGSEDVFSNLKLTEEIAAISNRRVELTNGGYLIIDHTEAMTVIDVNSGKYSGKETLEATIMEINIAAAKEIARQLRLRDIGGIIVVDFIDMHSDEHRNEVLSVLKEAFVGDKMKPKVQDITVLNLVEITRKKSRQNLSAVLYSPCPTCQGSGREQSSETIALEIKRRINTLLVKQNTTKDILVVANPILSDYLKMNVVKDWNREMPCTITVESDPTLHVETFMILDNTSR